MMKQIIILITALMIISGCKAQNADSNNIKKNKNMERTTEKFDSWKYYTQRQGSEYIFEDYLQGKVRQFGGDNGSEFVEYARKQNELFGTYKEFYNKTKTLKKVGKYYYNEFNIGLWKIYDENGYLIEAIDKDLPYKKYPWEKVEKFVKEELKLDLFDKNVSIRRYVSDKTNIPVWIIHYKVGSNIVSIRINANTGEIIKKGTNPIIK
ncbi:hypothetical protein [Prevotella fusca]|uniref:PepSY domain-containing protein n=1 Tax=Prevotella fusca JCM 17724 TaxID=1236517 RepID=A0A0K1NPC5_9BACT|nr:hypothetical protein [Prevotella fusca]AKU70521.1 hypothetical protein ADJ77_12315 [Prevotella fusca JCM 17724]QUB86160.1 hypothetical protein J5A51_02540 [Prevotella fusca JCM 17724]